jgi:ATP-dependent Lhr-like helicase
VDAGVLRQLRRRSIARLRHEVEAVEGPAFARLAIAWQGIGSKRRGPDALLDVIEQLQGAALPASILEHEILAARLQDYSPAWLDTTVAAGEVRWAGVAPLGQRDGRIALYLSDQMPDLLPPPDDEPLSDRESAIVEWLAREGASFFGPLHESTGGGFPGDTVDTLWQLVWRGLVTNDTLFPLRAFTDPPGRKGRRQERTTFRSRRLVPPSAEGRWTLVRPRGVPPPSPSVRIAAIARQLLSRHGVLTREALASEGVAGGFTAIYPALRAMDEAGRLRRGYFVAGQGATQFALPGALDRMRSLRDADPGADAVAVVLAATDPANPYGTGLPWPVADLSRVVGASVVIVDGLMAAYLARGDRELTIALPENEPFRTRIASAAAREIVAFGRGDRSRPRPMAITRINGEPALEHSFSAFLEEAGFVRAGTGLHIPRSPAQPAD